MCESALLVIGLSAALAVQGLAFNQVEQFLLAMHV